MVPATEDNPTRSLRGKKLVDDCIAPSIPNHDGKKISKLAPSVLAAPYNRFGIRKRDTRHDTTLNYPEATQ